MRKPFLLLAVCFLLIGCKIEKKNSLEGVWELVEARYTTAGKTESKNEKVIKMYTKNHWVIMAQAPNRQKFNGEGSKKPISRGTNFATNVLNLFKNSD